PAFFIVRNKMKVLAVDPGSPLYGYVRPGYKIKSVNGKHVLDAIDFRFRTTDERVNIIFIDNLGKELAFKFDEINTMSLGLTLDDGRIKVCKNDCIFCFINQQPQGMRRILYLKDEDYRLSFTHGNFITLSNTTDEDINRIIEQRLSPLYVSVHASDDKLRRCMLRNEKLVPIIPRIRQLTENSITIHTQVVLCPGVNDGIYLEKTINELARLYPGVESLAVVPVGLTKYRSNLPHLRRYSKEEAIAIIKYVEKRQKEFHKTLGSRFVWVADEFYVIAGREFPRRKTYEEMSQFENGIGMAREFITAFNRRRSNLKKINSKKRVLFLTGYSAYSFLNNEILSYVRETLSLDLAIVPVKNMFWGEMVTVSGLLTGQDMLRQARKKLKEYDTLVLPPNCLNNDNLFLDNLSLPQFQTALGKKVVVGQYDLFETINEVFV
ncbi:MAG: DUF512 domain-containing protein, partial [Candidatus Zixiibacteriota bacterium]